MARSRRSRTTTRPSTRLAAETLERRAMLAVSSVWLANRVLVIESDASATQASVSRSGSDILLQSTGGRDVRVPAAWVDTVEFRGGPGNDTFRSTLDSHFLLAHGNGGNDTLEAGPYGSALYGGPGDDTLRGGAGRDFIAGGAGADTIAAGGAADYVDGEQGDDRIAGGDGNDTLLGGPGNDTIHGGADDDFIAGAEGNDVAYGEIGRDRLYGDAGHDRLDGGPWRDLIYGGAGDDLLLGGADGDFLDGGAGDDRLIAGDGEDVLLGGEGRDGLVGGPGTVRLEGGPGADRFLRQGGTTITDRRPEDAVVNFRNGSSAWTAEELQVVDEAFAELQSVTGSTRLLKESRGGGELLFVKEGGHVPYAGLNEEIPIYRKTWDYYRFKHVTRLVRIDRVIRIADFDERKADERRDAALTVIHEIGHNWDSADERAAAGVPAASWREFAAISQWRSARGMGPGHVRSGDGLEAFAASARDGFFGHEDRTHDGRWMRYGQTNVYEDFATSFTEWFQRTLGTRTANPHRETGTASATSIAAAGAGIAAAKLASVERLVRSV